MAVWAAEFAKLKATLEKLNTERLLKVMAMNRAIYSAGAKSQHDLDLAYNTVFAAEIILRTRPHVERKPVRGTRFVTGSRSKGNKKLKYVR